MSSTIFASAVLVGCPKTPEKQQKTGNRRAANTLSNYGLSSGTLCTLDIMAVKVHGYSKKEL